MHSQQENYLSFSNITHNMKARKASPGVSHCRLHPDKRVRYRDLDSYQSYCTTCAVQEASRGARIEEVNFKQDIPSVYRSLSIIYERSQQNIRAQIETYNSKHQHLFDGSDWLTKSHGFETQTGLPVSIWESVGWA